MKKILFVITAFNIFLYAQLNYSVKASLLGEIAKVNITSNIKNKRYTLQLKLTTTGIAKMMSGSRKEIYKSKGRIKDGSYYADVFTVKQTFKNKKYFKKYTFDYKKHKIKKVYQKWENGKLTSTTTKYLKYFSHNDLLTLYHNILQFKKSNKNGHYRISAAGAERGGSSILFELPNDTKTKKVLKKLSVKNASAMMLDIRRSYLSKGRGTMIFAIAKNGIAKKVTMNHVKMVGSLSIYRK